MEVIDWKWEQNEMEVEEGGGGLQVRSSKVTKEVTNGKIETNGHGNSTLKMTNGTEKSDLGDEQERSEEEKLSDSINGVEDEEGTEPKDKLFEHIVVSINGVEEKSDLDDEQERSEEEHISDFNNGVEEGTEKSDLDDELERSEEEHISDSYNGVEVEEETKTKEESVQHILLSNNGVEVEVQGETKLKEESVQLIVASNNGVEEGTEPKEESIQKIVAINGVEERTEPKEESVQKIVASNNGVEERTEPKEESVQKIVVSNNGVEEGTEPKEESKQHLVTSTNGVEVEKGTEAEEDSVQQIVVVSNNGVEEGTEAKEESKQHLVTFTNGVEVEEGAEESIRHIVVSNNEVKEGTEPKKESKQHLVISTNGVEEGTEAEEGPFSSGHSVYYDKDEDSNFISTPSIKEKIDKIPGDEGVQESATLDIHLNGYLKSYNSSSSSVQFSKNLSEDHSIVHKSTAIDEIESADPDLIDDSDTDVKDFDVENVLQKQNTHDLYCPNCKSCITKRVILRKRKRKIQVSGDDVKRVKPEVIVDSKVDASHAQAADDEVRDGADCSLDGTPPLAVDDYQPDREPELFRCLSCFSFFIPAGNGFKLFRFFGDKGAKENVKGEQTPTKNKKWFSPIFGLDKGKAPVEQGSGIGASAVKNDSGVLMPSAPPAYSSSEITQEAGGKILGSKNQDANMKGKMVIDTVGKSENATKSREGSVLDIFDSETYNQPSVSASSNEVQGNDKNDELLRNTGKIQVSNGNLVQESLPASSDKKDELLRPGGKIQFSNGNLVQDSVPPSQQNELKLLITSTKEESLTIEKSETDSKSDVAILNKDPATTAFALNGLDGNGKPNFLTEIPQEHVQHTEAMFSSESLVANNDNKFQLSSEDGAHHYEVSQHTITKTNIEIHSKQPLNVDEHDLISSVKDALSIQDKPDNIPNISVVAAANNIAAGNDTIITVEAGHETRETASANLDTQIQSVEGQATDGADGYKIEIIKSIIFGGLAESITSLSVVASATGGDTTTLNILVLAMANLFGGLFIIFHNLWELKRDRFEHASNQIMEKHVDRYREQLGRRENFTLHAVLVILSYIIFGLLPPVTYGFSFRKSDDKDLKIVAVAAASLVCVLMLATGKAYVQRAPKPYFKTISTYIILGFTVSGVSYAAGILFNRLLEKLGFFQPSSTVNLFLPEMPETGAAWASF